jgi:hypothetical protein
LLFAAQKILTQFNLWIRLFLYPRKAPRGPDIRQAGYRIINANQPAFYDEIVSWDLQIEFPNQPFRFGEFNFRSAVRNIEDGTRKPLPIVKFNNGGLEHWPPAKFAQISGTVYCQVLLGIFILLSTLLPQAYISEGKQTRNNVHIIGRFFTRAGRFRA